MANLEKKSKTIPLNGKLMTGDPATIGQNFQTLTNMRYTDTHIKGVSGNTKINTTALTTYLKARNAFHFKKVQPAETHLLVQSYNTGLTASQLLDNLTAIPSAGDFSATAVWTDSTGAGRGYFCNAPDGQMVYANGVDTCIWGGNEMVVGAVISSTAVVGDDGSATNPKDFTEAMQNTKTDSENICHIGGGQDSYCKFLSHFDGADGDTADQTAATGQTISLEGNACLDTAYKKFGSASLLLDGTGDYATVPDSTDWYFAAAPFTIDMWANINVLDENERGICGQYTDANNYWKWSYKVTGGVSLTLYFKIVSGGVTKADYSVSRAMGSSFQHLVLGRDGTHLYMWHNRINCTLTETTAISTNEVPNLTGAFEIGSAVNHSLVMAGWIDEFRVSKGILRYVGDAWLTLPTSPYLPDWRYLLIGSPRPLQGIKPYVSLANTIASTMTGKVWDGSTWAPLTITDNTDTGASLAQTGTITFASTVTTAKPKYLEGYYLFWYQFYLDVGEAEIYKITMDAPFQGIIDLWDGQYRDIAAAYKRTASLDDIGLKVLKDDYDTDTADTYADLSGLLNYPANGHDIEFGFTEKLCGLHFRLPPEYTNSTAATTMSIDYWNGTSYVSVGAVSDGTSEGAISFAKSGTVTWNNANLTDETKTQKMGAATVYTDFTDPSTTEAFPGFIFQQGKAVAQPLYFYRVRFDKNLDGSVRLNYVGGITSEKDISHYKFPVFAQGRVLLCADISEKKNSFICSGKYMPQVYNGTDSVEVFFGDDGELNCGVELFSQYNGNLYSMILMFKDTEMWVVAGQDIKAWADNIFPVSTSIGCPAPQTLKTINLVAEPGQGINRSLAIWQGVNGIYMSDGRSPIPIHGDIKEYFDKNDSRCIKASMIGDSISFMDYTNQEYHWLFASGTAATTLNTELVYDVKRNKWLEIDRGTGMDLQCGVEVQDTYGNQYAYGFIDTGYMERLEYGTTFDGTDIEGTFQLGDYLPADTIMEETMIDKVKLITKSKTTTTNKITGTHYGDSSTTGTVLKTGALAPQKSGHRVAMPFVTDNLGGYTFHSLKFSMITDDEVCGLEPMGLGIIYHIMRVS